MRIAQIKNRIFKLFYKRRDGKRAVDSVFGLIIALSSKAPFNAFAAFL